MADEQIEQPTPRIVAAVATAVSVKNDPQLSAVLEKALAEAVLLALSHGVKIEDGPTMLRYKNAARTVVLAGAGRETPKDELDAATALLAGPSTAPETPADAE